MARRNKSYLTNKFETGDKPVGTDFADWIESGFNLEETSAQTVSGSVTFLNSVTADTLSGDGSGITGVLTASYAVSSSHEIIKEVSSSHADNADNAISASYAITASHALNVSDPFPFVGDAVITGSLTISGSLIAGGNKGLRVTSIGIDAGLNATSDDNVFIGYSSGKDLSNAGSTMNVAVGNNSMGAAGSSAGTNNVAIGQQSLYSINGGDYNVAIGNSAGTDINSGTSNVVIGSDAGVSLTTGNNNILIGQGTYGNATTTAGAAGMANTLRIGAGTVIPISASLATGDVLFPSTASAAYFSGDGSQLSGISSDPFPYTGDVLITGNVTASGHISSSGDIKGDSLSTDNYVYLNGYGSNTYLRADGSDVRVYKGGSSKVVIGNSLAFNNFSAVQITNADLNITAGRGITAVGSITASGDVSSSITSTASFGTYLGDGSQLSGITSTPFPFVGDAVITGSLTISGSFNAFRVDSDDIVLGKNAGAAMIAGATTRNVLIGENAGDSITDSPYNVAIGYNTLQAATSGANGNVALGFRAGQIISTGDRNIGIGDEGGSKITTGHYNIALGLLSMGGNNNKTGNDNVCIGQYTGEYLSSGANNIFIGYKAGNTTTTGGNNILIGYDIEASAVGASDELRIGYGTVHPISASLSTGDVLFPSTASAAYFSGDGSQLTNLPASSTFPYTGSTAAIISRSIAPGDTDSTTLRLLGSGSISGSGLFEIQGSSTTLFSVTDDMTGELFAANDASGLSIISAHADRTVKLGKPGGFGIVISGSNPMPTDADARIEISGSTYFTGTTADFSGVGTVTGLPASDPFPYSGSAIISSSFTAGDTNSNTLKLIGSGSVSGSGIFEIEGSTGTLFSAVDSMSGSLMAVTDASGIPILEVFSDNTVTANGFKGWRPYQTQATSFVLQLGDMGTYNRCGGVAVTASLSASSAIPFALGTEIEFFQTSSAGNLLITASAGSGVTINSKNGNLKLAGQFSAATLKKVGTDEWDLIGDLT